MLKQDLISARDLLINVGWNQKHIAQNNNKERVEADDQTAVSYCAMGAVAKACNSFNSTPNKRELDVIHALKSQLTLMNYKGGIITFNDNPDRTKEEVIVLFNRTIENQNETYTSLN